MAHIHGAGPRVYPYTPIPSHTTLDTLARPMARVRGRVTRGMGKGQVKIVEGLPVPNTTLLMIWPPGHRVFSCHYFAWFMM